MAAKQPQATKKQALPQGRSVMLTRFKLSQQKRQLREKERRTAQSNPQSKITSPTSKTPEDKKHSNTKIVSPSKSVKRAPNRVLKDSVELQPKTLQRRKASKKIVLKPRHELKVIGGSGSGSCKRKLNLPQKGTNSPPAKRKKFSRGLNSGPSEPDRSQSPIYSELGFEEVIRMVDENHSLDDDDLLEILTCPSPVWWEDPPDDDYTEGPIIISSKITTLPANAKQFRSRTARKKTPHKIILEQVESTDNNKKEDKEDTETVINAATFDSINKTDDKFKNKRSKLESLLSTIKDKLNISKFVYNNDKSIKEESIIEDCTDNKDLLELKSTNDRIKCVRSKQDADMDTNDDIMFAHIIEQDKDCLKHLEDIEIPIEGANTKASKTTDRILEIKTQDVRKNPPSVDKTKMLAISKNFPKFHTNKKLKILNIKKLSTNGTQKNITVKPILKEKRKSNEKIPAKDKDTNLSVDQVEKTNSEINQNHDNERESDINCKKHTLSVEKQYLLSKHIIEDSEIFESVHKSLLQSMEIPSNTEDYVTIFKIISSADDNTNNVKARHIAEEKEDIKEELITESDISDREAKTLDSYYKKCKSRKRESIKTNNIVTEDTEAVKEVKHRKEDIRTGENIKALCDSCDKDSKMSIIVPSTTDVRYCLKCSSIFDLEECNYCIRKEKQIKRHKNLEESHDTKSDVNLIDIQNSINRHYV